MVDGIKVSGIKDTDLSVTLRRQITTTTAANNSTTGNMSSPLPVTVIATKLPITNLSAVSSTVAASTDLAMTTTQNSANPMDATTGQIGSNAAIQSNAFQILSLLKNLQIGTASIVNANWTLPQTVSMGFLGLGNRIAASAPSDFVLVVVVPFQGISNMPTLPLR